MSRCAFSFVKHGKKVNLLNSGKIEKEYYGAIFEMNVVEKQKIISIICTLQYQRASMSTSRSKQQMCSTSIM